jgi:hypothetical protein
VGARTVEVHQQDALARPAHHVAALDVEAHRRADAQQRQQEGIGAGHDERRGSVEAANVERAARDAGAGHQRVHLVGDVHDVGGVMGLDPDGRLAERRDRGECLHGVLLAAEDRSGRAASLQAGVSVS